MPPVRRFPFRFNPPSRLLIGLRPRWLQHIGNHKVLEDDQVFLHWQERVLGRPVAALPWNAFFHAHNFRRLRGGPASLVEHQRRRAHLQDNTYLRGNPPRR